MGEIAGTEVQPLQRRGGEPKPFAVLLHILAPPLERHPPFAAPPPLPNLRVERKGPSSVRRHPQLRLVHHRGGGDVVLSALAVAPEVAVVANLGERRRRKRPPVPAHPVQVVGE
ncbi:Os02g0108302 [Oryza sativa Japonica Group]|uniref:Os02g0108302 protein n=1 Tax=Oryza sativa subsp. japonica TaxID=39947 RepID=A0A0P0VDX6_ORYSJ|nr:hypothetical protein EE612_008350 [Oryza sativa]BAS76590.1 Os02g0108302 [Oryza sativa Japonica Group]